MRQRCRSHVWRSLTVAAAVVVCLGASASAPARQQPIAIDALYDDWTDVPVAYDDPAGDGAGIDFDRLWIADDARFLFLRFQLGGESDLSENNELRLLLDTDANSATGLPVGGIGAELLWRFGARIGTVFSAGETTSIRQNHIRFRGAPTVNANEFEVAIGRDTLPDGQNPLFTGPIVRVFLVDGEGGDQLPDAGQVLEYSLDEEPLGPEPPRPIGRQRATDLRIVTHNVLFDAPWDSGQEPRFGRQYAAVAPDIVNLQEVYDHTPAQAAALIGRWVPLGPGESWYSAGNGDCKTISRYPLLDTWSLDTNLAVLVDTSSVLGMALLLINAHLPCCTDDAGRQSEIDRIMSFIREAQSPGGPVDLAQGTPILITGDLNLVGLTQQLDSLVSGDIVDETTFGSDFAPDWDGSDLTSLISHQTEKRMGYTWRNDSGTFWPGQLDFQIYSDSVLQTGTHFLLYTPEMSGASLGAFGLQGTDSLASDHILFCADYRGIVEPCSADVDGDGDVDLDDFAGVVACLAGPAGGLGAGCGCFDTDDDGDLDLRDFAAFQRGFTGPLGLRALPGASGSP